MSSLVRPSTSKSLTGMLRPPPSSFAIPRKAASVPSVVMSEFTRSFVMANPLITATSRAAAIAATIAAPRP